LTKREKLRRAFSSLYAKTLYVILLGALVGVGIYFGGSALGVSAVNARYMTRAAVAERREAAQTSFRQFVRENNIASTDAQAIAAWVAAEQNVTLQVYEDDRVTARTDTWGNDPSAGRVGMDPGWAGRGGNSVRTISGTGLDDSFFRVAFADGLFPVSLYEYSQYAIYDAVNFVCLVAALAVFILLVLWMQGRLIRRTRSLARSAYKIGRGDLETPIQARGQDELALLAREMDAMRLSITERIESERVAMEANRDLITAISHDIRTPLTTMMGYLDLLREGQVADETQKSAYVETVYEKSLQLKDLTDRLFRYFLAYGNADIVPEMVDYDAQILTEQLLGEHLAELRDLGFKLEADVDVPEGWTVSADARFLRRTLDNLVSNVKKHADRDAWVTALANIEDGQLSIYLANAVPAEPTGAESTKIGLKTCRRMMEEQGGELRVYDEGHRFAAELLLPVRRTEQTGGGNV